MYSHLLGTVGGPLHPVSGGQEAEQAVGRNPGVGRAAQGDQLPQEHPEAPHVRLGGVQVVPQRLRGHPLDGHCRTILGFVFKFQSIAVTMVNFVS